MTTYYTLLSRRNNTQPWEIEFGDYDRQTVKDEKEITRGVCKIITTDEAQAAIQAKVDELNKEVSDERQTMRFIPEVERIIIKKLVKDILKAGYAIRVHDGEEYATEITTKKKTILNEVGETETTVLVVYKSIPLASKWSRIGSVTLIHGNMCDVISDWSWNNAQDIMDQLVSGANAKAEKFH